VRGEYFAASIFQGSESGLDNFILSKICKWNFFNYVSSVYLFFPFSFLVFHSVQMEKLSGSLKAAKHAGLRNNRFAEYAYKPARTYNVPFGLETSSSNILSEILACSLTQSVAGLMAQAKAPGTMENYERAAKKFEDFCGVKGYAYPNFDEKSILCTLRHPVGQRQEFHGHTVPGQTGSTFGREAIGQEDLRLDGDGGYLLGGSQEESSEHKT
jgi:hypothetical protein